MGGGIAAGIFFNDLEGVTLADVSAFAGGLYQLHLGVDAILDACFNGCNDHAVSDKRSSKPYRPNLFGFNFANRQQQFFIGNIAFE